MRADSERPSSSASRNTARRGREPASVRQVRASVPVDSGRPTPV